MIHKVFYFCSQEEMDVQETVSRYLDEVKRNGAESKLRAILSCSAKKDVIKWTDKKGNDLMHLCILQNSPETVEFLLSNGYFVEPHQPEVNPYIHLAAKLGFRTLLNILLSFRLSDNRPMNNLIYPSQKSESDVSQQNKVINL